MSLDSMEGLAMARRTVEVLSEELTEAHRLIEDILKMQRQVTMKGQELEYNCSSLQDYADLVALLAMYQTQYQVRANNLRTERWEI